MNKIYKVVKNQSGKQTVASELAKGKSKGILSSLTAIALAGTLSASAIAAPTLVEDGLIAPNSKQAVNGGQISQLEQTLYTSVVQSVNTKKVAEQASNSANALNTQVNAMSGTVTANTNTATTAKNTAESAKATADTATKSETAANQATLVSQQAVEKSEQSANTAQQALTVAQNADAQATAANVNATKATESATQALTQATTANQLATTADGNAKQAQAQATSANNLATTAKANADKAMGDATKAIADAHQAVTTANTANDKADSAVSASQQAVQKVDLVEVQVKKHDTQINAVQTSLAETAKKAEQAELIGVQARNLGENALSQAKSVSNRVETLEQSAVQYNADKSAVSVNNATLNDLADGEISATSTQAVTGKQLHATEQKVEKVVKEQLVPVQKQVADTKAEVASNKAEITTNKANIAKNTQRMGQVVEVVNAQTTRINENTRIVKAQAERITRNTQTINENRQAINENRQAITQNSRRIDNLEQQSHKDRRQARAGVAGAMAMTQITPVQGKTFTIGAGVGTYRGETAVAVGVKYAPKPNVVISLSGSADSRGGVGAATGVSLGLN